MKKIIYLSIVLFLSACATTKKASSEDSIKITADSLDKRCYMQPDPGMCRAAIPRYYYDKTDGKCKAFTWGGCQGLVPFNSLEECMKTCGCEPEK